MPMTAPMPPQDGLDHAAHAAALFAAYPGKAETPQQRFERMYVTSSELCRDLGVSRPAIMQARRRKLLPEPIAVNGTSIYIWERATVTPYVDAWRIVLTARRNHTTSTTAGTQESAAAA